MPWEAGGPSPNQHAYATPPRIWNIPIYGANIAAGLSGQKFERSKVCIRTENHTSANTSRFFVPWEAGGPSPTHVYRCVGFCVRVHVLCTCTSPQEHLSCIVYFVFRRPLPCNPSTAHMCISHSEASNHAL